jgi:hypothetical protein
MKRERKISAGTATKKGETFNKLQPKKGGPRK